MRNADLFTPRPTLTSPSLLARAVEVLSQSTTSQTEIWRRLTDRFAVDLDAVAALVPCGEAEPVWLRKRD